jgi:uncharacterized YccA/Bax inhibitor family protein
MMRSGNPALRADTFNNLPAVSNLNETMSIAGTVRKCFILLALTVATASWSWSRPESLGASLWIAALAGFGVALVTVFKKSWSPLTAPLYALLEGVVLGAISGLMERSYPGIVVQAVLLTFGTLFALLLAYQSGWIQPTENFKLGIVAATGGILVVYLVSMVMGLFGRSIPLIHSAGPAGIIFSLVVVTIAALNLVLDFDFIEQGSAAGAPKYMEWYGAFGLIVTLFWLYLEILRLLSKARRR